MKLHKTDRRSFAKTIATTAVAALAPTLVLGRAKNSKLQHACIGVGGKGLTDLKLIMKHPELEIVALCDVDSERLAAAAELAPQARRYRDWRELLEVEADRCDSINVSTPDHMHAPIAMSALKAGKHVYCQKPLAHDLFEVRQLTAAARKAGVATQMGIQGSSSIGNRLTVRLIQEGAIGKIDEVFLWSNKDAKKFRPEGPRPPLEHPVPATLDWDKWLGTAPVRPYVKEIYHPLWWRGWQDFGVGWLGDMGCHITHPVFRGLKLTAPLTIRADVEPEWRDSPERRTQTWPRWQIVYYSYPGTEFTADRTLKLTWFDGGKYPPDRLLSLVESKTFPEQGALVLGDEGTLFLPYGEEPQLFPKGEKQSYPKPELEPRDHYLNYVDACLGKQQPTAPFEYAGPLTEAVLLGTVALRCTGREIAWNQSKLESPGDSEANRYLRRVYRKGWEVEGLS